MNKAYITIFAIFVAATAVLGTAAVTRTTALGRAAQHTNDSAVASQTKQLAAYAAKLQKELKAKPPALPPVPKRVTPVAAPVTAVAPAAAAPAAATAQPQAPKIVYHRPPPIVTVVHTHHGGDDSHEADRGDGGGGGGEGD